MVAIELVKPGVGDGRTPDPDLTKRIQAEALARKLIVLTAGTYVNVIRIIPPLVTTAAEVDLALVDPRREAGRRRRVTDAASDDRPPRLTAACVRRRLLERLAHDRRSVAVAAMPDAQARPPAASIGRPTRLAAAGRGTLLAAGASRCSRLRDACLRESPPGSRAIGRRPGRQEPYRASADDRVAAGRRPRTPRSRPSTTSSIDDGRDVLRRPSNDLGRPGTWRPTATGAH